MAPGERTLLAADVGAAFTKAYLLADVEGERRLVSVGRVPSLGLDGQPVVGPALDLAARQALATAGAPATPAALAGVPRLVLTSAGAVPRVALLATGEEEARKVAAALERDPVRLLDPITLGPPGTEQLLSQLEAQAPDVVVVAGDAPGGSRAAAAVEALVYGFGGRLPMLVLGGDPAVVAACAAHLEGRPFVSAAGDGWAAAEAVRRLASAQLARAVALEESGAADWMFPLPVSSLVGVATATEVIAERYDVDVLTLDLGAGHAMAVVATGTAGQRRLTVAARDDLGSRWGLQQVLRAAGPDALARWLPMDVDAAALGAAARRGRTAPAALPETVKELLIEHAFARELLRLVLADLAVRRQGAGERGVPPVDLLVGSGGLLASVPRLIQAALILLDAAQPEALTQLALDRTTALPLIGRLAEMGDNVAPVALGNALERDGLLNLGLCIAPVGAGKEGETAIKVEIAYASRSPVTVEVPFGAIEVVPLPVGERAALKLWPGRDFDIGLGRGNAATPRAEVEGGAVGIIVDARGRPLGLPDDHQKRQAKLLQWLQGTRAYPPLSFVRPAYGGAEPGDAGLAGEAAGA